MNATGKHRATADFRELAEIDAVLICVPTPFAATRDLDLPCIIATSETIARYISDSRMLRRISAIN